MKKTMLILAVAASMTAITAQADITIGLGTAKSNLEPDGTWRQPTFQQEARVRDSSWMIGWESMISKHIGYRVAYHSWGRQTLAAGYLSGGDYRFVDNTSNHCDGACPATNWAFSYHEAKGLEASMKFQMDLSSIQPYMRLGVVKYHAEQTTDVPDMGEADNPDTHRRSFCVYHMASSGISGMGSVGVGYKWLAIEYSKTPSVRAMDSAFRGITELMVTATVPF